MRERVVKDNSKIFGSNTPKSRGPSTEMGNIPGRISLTDSSYQEEVKNSYQVSSSKITSEMPEKNL